MHKNKLPLVLLLGALLALLTCGISAYLLAHMPLVWKISGGLSLALFLGYFVVERSMFAEAFSKKTTRYGLNSLLMSLIALAIVVVVNLIAVEHDIKKDFTKNKLHTLSDQTLKVLKNLKSEVKLKAFIAPAQMADFDSIFDKYAYQSDKIKKEYVDLDKDPFIVQKYNIKQAGTVIIESDARTARVENLQGPDDPKVEEKITNAIIQVAKGEKKKVYFVTGHGERLTSDTGKEGYSEIKESLESSRYKVEEILLVDKDKMPADADLVVVAGPKSDFMDHELKLLESYVRGGGHLLFMAEANSSPTIKPFLEKFGAEWNLKKMVLETNRLQQLAGGNPFTPIVTTYDPGHEVTSEARQMSIFPMATPIEKTKTPPPGMKIDTLFSSSNRSIEVNFEGDKVKVDEKKDRKGPLSMALAVSGKAEKAAEKSDTAKVEDAVKDAAKDAEKKEAEFRVIIVGDSDFAANGVRRFGINSDLFQNMLSWLSKEEDMISIRPRPTNTSEFEITEERARIINLSSIILAPFAMFLSGILVWLSRRRK